MFSNALLIVTAVMIPNFVSPRNSLMYWMYGQRIKNSFSPLTRANRVRPDCHRYNERPKHLKVGF